MQIDDCLWLEEVLDKLIVKHSVEFWEVEEMFRNIPRIRFRQQGDRSGEDVYTALGQTDKGRYLFVVFIHKPRNPNRRLSLALVMNARDMDKKERKHYDRK